ncbi:MAG: DNA polymerase III subunit alpha, partial [Candidatus Marinimicrobia bacterium]|nr:DNA polymerase III subunit alpha [Candidatus Neomarinimicrobiota bacterium]
HTDKTSTRASGWGYNHLVLLAQNQTGLKNLIKLVSIGYLDGFYYRPRIDKELLRRYSEGLICTSGCLKGEVQENAVYKGFDAARDSALELAEIFDGRFYLELQRHDIPEENAAVEINIKLAHELNLPLVATNDCHYARKEHWEAHDIMFCLGTGKDRDDPNRQRYATPEFYFKSVDEMHALFKDVPQALENTVAIAEQCNVELELGTMHLPNFPIPEASGATDADDYLRMISMEGLKERSLDTTEAHSRMERELGVIRSMGYAGYFLIVTDFIRFARGEKIPVGPGRGSAAGSLVAYALRITDVDPLRYNLLFERFLNPDRISMPDIDIDFCQDRRGEVIDYVKRQYGEEAVCQIITFGKLKAKSVVRDVARVLGMSYGEADRIAKLIPDDPKTTIDDAVAQNPELALAEDMDDRHRELFAFSRVLEGMNRHASTHAAGVVIAPGDLTDYVPLYRHPKTGEITTQVDMNGLEEMGLLKMDFLGLRTLTVIDRAVKMLAARGVHVDIEKLPLDDEATYKIFAQGRTIGVFQFESSGMREFLTKLQPTAIEDLIAMNALYRPGPMAYIDDFIDRKHGRKKIVYMHADLEPILKETYGIIVYQEQVMQIAHDIAGFTLAQADLMRRAMGKKKVEEMAKMELDFVKGAQSKGVDGRVAQEIYALMARFAAYGFNKSHSTAYAIVAYQTAYLKAHHPAEFMAANLSSEMSNPDRMPVLMAEARARGIKILPPDVNLSGRNFRVDSEGRIIFGLNAIKHVGQKAADHIRDARLSDNPWRTLPQFLSGIDLTVVNKKAVECLVRSGACDSLEGNRQQQYELIEQAVRF